MSLDVFGAQWTHPAFTCIASRADEGQYSMKGSAYVEKVMKKENTEKTVKDSTDIAYHRD